MTGTNPAHPSRVVVIGGGMAGLVVAWELARSGHRPLLLEAGDTVGGVLSAHRVAGLLLDAGAESYATTRPSAAELIDELRLGPAVVRPNPVGAWVRHRTGSAPLPTGGLLGIPARPWAADVRRVLGTAGSARACLDLALPRGSGPRTSLGALVRARMGRRVLDRLVEPVAGGVYAADPDALEVQTVAPALVDALRRTGSLSAAVRGLRGDSTRPGGAVASLVGGMHTLAAALHSAVQDAGGTVRTGTRVTGMTRIDPGQEATDWQIDVASGTRIFASHVVIATPGPTAATLLAGAVRDLPEHSVLHAPATEVLLCTLVLDDARLDRAPRGTGVLVSSAATGVCAKALTHATAKWAWLADVAGPGRHVLRLSYGRGGEADLPAVADLPGIALQDASTLLGVDLPRASVVDAAVVRWASALPVPAPGHAAGVRALRDTLAPLDIEIAGSAVAGTGLAAVVADARRVADRLGTALNPARASTPTTAATVGAASPGIGPAGD